MTAYIYVLKCPESGAVRYVGKCINLKARFRQHTSESRIGLVKSHKCDWIRSLQKRGLSPVMEVDSLVSAGQDWKSVEVQRVAHYKALGCDLTNATDGGDEPGELSEEGRKILATRCSQSFGTPEGRALQSERMKRLCSDPAWRAARDAAAKATRATPEYKARMSARAKAKWNEPGYRERMIAARAEVVARPEYKEKLSRATKAWMTDPANHGLKSEARRAAWAARKARSAV